MNSTPITASQSPATPINTRHIVLVGLFWGAVAGLLLPLLYWSATHIITALENAARWRRAPWFGIDLVKTLFVVGLTPIVIGISAIQGVVISLLVARFAGHSHTNAMLIGALSGLCVAIGFVALMASIMDSIQSFLLYNLITNSEVSIGVALFANTAAGMLLALIQKRHSGHQQRSSEAQIPRVP